MAKVGEAAEQVGARRAGRCRPGRGTFRAVAAVALPMVLGACGVFRSEPAPPPPPAETDAPAAEPSAADTVAAEADSVRAAPDTAGAPEPEPEEVEEAPAEPAEEEAGPAAEEATPEEEVREGRAAEREGAEPVVEPRATWEPVPVLPGAILPRERIVAFYGHANSTKMGILGELPPDRMLARLQEEVTRWEEADPDTPVRPALHLITTMATGDPGHDEKYRLRMPSKLVERVHGWAREHDALLFLDIQPGRADVEDELPRLRRWLVDPDVHLALDPEWDMPEDGVPGEQIGSMRAEDVNAAIDFLAEIVEEHDLPPKVLVVHRFTQHMLPDLDEVELDPRVQLVVNMDGWGPPAQKLNTYRVIVAPEIPQWAGFKLFFKNDRWGGSRMLTPAEILALAPVPFYIQYQ